MSSHICAGSCGCRAARRRAEAESRRPAAPQQSVSRARTYRASRSVRRSPRALPVAGVRERMAAIRAHHASQEGHKSPVQRRIERAARKSTT